MRNQKFILINVLFMMVFPQLNKASIKNKLRELKPDRMGELTRLWPVYGSRSWPDASVKFFINICCDYLKRAKADCKRMTELPNWFF